MADRTYVQRFFQLLNRQDVLELKTSNIRISIVIVTLNRLKELNCLLASIKSQTLRPFEIVIVDTSKNATAKQISESKGIEFIEFGIHILYIQGGYRGLTSARNIGSRNSCGDAILFVDDDSILEPNVIASITSFLQQNESSYGVQPQLIQSNSKMLSTDITRSFFNAFCKAFMLSYYLTNTQTIRKSGASISPLRITRTIAVNRFTGCACYRRHVLEKLQFDENLVKWSFLEDLDFSYRVSKAYPNSLFVLHDCRIIHKRSKESRIPNKHEAWMRSVYWWYIFFKNLYRRSIVNLIAFLISQIGRFFLILGRFLFNRTRDNLMEMHYILSSFALVFHNVNSIIVGRLDFFNNMLLDGGS